MSWVASAYFTPSGFISSSGGVLGSVYSGGNPTVSAFDSGMFPFIYADGDARSVPESSHYNRPKFEAYSLPVYPSSISAFDHLDIGWTATTAYDGICVPTGDNEMMSGSGITTVSIDSITTSTATMLTPVYLRGFWPKTWNPGSQTMELIEYWRLVSTGYMHTTVHLSESGLSFFRNREHYNQSLSAIYTATSGTFATWSADNDRHWHLESSASATETAKPSAVNGLVRPLGTYIFAASKVFITGITAVGYDRPLEAT